MDNKFEFAPDALTVNGSRLPASYAVEGETVCITVQVEQDGCTLPLRIDFTPNHPDHPAALAVAQAAGIRPEAQPEPEEAPTMLTTLQNDLAICLQPLTIPAELLPEVNAAPDFEPVQSSAEEAAPSALPVPFESTPEAPADTAQAARPAEKTFIGTRIEGRGWLIYFDEAAARTRVILNREPSAAVLQAVTAAGFYWSDRMGSFNKKLTWRAFRAAQALAQQLTALC